MSDFGNLFPHSETVNSLEQHEPAPSHDSAADDSSSDGKISFRAREPLTCPVCSQVFHREELHTGGGRMNAGRLTDELHRLYLPTQRYGKIHPLVYSVTVCPRCWYAAFPQHFLLPEPDILQKIRDETGQRKSLLRPTLPRANFDQDRTLVEGIASYVLSALCYEHQHSDTTPTFMRGLSFLRAGWLATDLSVEQPGEHYDYMAKIFLRKATFFYKQTVERIQNGTEGIEYLTFYGPDLDHNYGYDSMLYIMAVLELKYGQKKNLPLRIRELKEARAAVAKIVGMGKSTKEKPGPLLEKGRKLHKDIKTELERMNSEQKHPDSDLL